MHGDTGPCTAEDCCNPTCADTNDDGDGGSEIDDAFPAEQCAAEGLVLKHDLAAATCEDGVCSPKDCCVAPANLLPPPRQNDDGKNIDEEEEEEEEDHTHHRYVMRTCVILLLVRLHWYCWTSHTTAQLPQ